MSGKRPEVKNGAAMLKNVINITEAMMHAVERSRQLPGLVCFHGESGFGKSSAAVFLAGELRAYHVEVDSTCTKKELLLDVAEEMGLVPGRTIRDLKRQIGEHLSLSGRPLIIDDAHHLAKRGILELVLDLHKKAGERSTVLLIGEPALPFEMKRRWERIDNRILRWVEAKPLDWDDAVILRDHYAAGVAVADDLLADIHSRHKGCARRVVVELEEARAWAISRGRKEMDLAQWKSRGLTHAAAAPTPDAPKMRVVK
ncbi:MAG: ATP-binding protein [Magnetococcales bacterium]|nr:ATP-binding protein [Magnetococcales bacterium]